MQSEVQQKEKVDQEFLKQSGGSEERKPTEKKRQNDGSTCAGASFMAPLPFALRDLCLKVQAVRLFPV